MPARRLSDLWLVSGAVVAIAVLSLLGAILAPASNPIDQGTSTFSAGPPGTKGAYLTLAELGYRVERSIEPMTAVEADPSTTTLILSGEEPPSEQDRRTIREFVEQGGTLLAVGANGAYALGLVVPSDVPLGLQEEIETFHPLTPSPLSVGASAVNITARLTAPKFTDPYVALYGSAAEPVVATATLGLGRAVWFADNTPFCNAYLDKADNLRLFLNTVGPAAGRQVIFDEHYQGHKRSLWSYVGGTPLPWFGLQAGLVMVAVLLTHSRRQGPVRAPHEEARTSPMEFVDMLGALYRRAHARQAAVHAARLRLRRAIAAACGVPAATEDETLARAAAARLHTDAAGIGALLAEADAAAGQPDLSTARALDLMQRLQKLTGQLVRS
jgi:Domain of unknown function (DUF4350)